MGIRVSPNEMIWGEDMPLSDKDQRGPVGHGLGEIRFQNSNFWPTQSLTPIPAGGACLGWFWSSFKQNQIDEAFKNQYYVVVTFKDVVTGHQHQVEQRLHRGFGMKGITP